MDRLCRFLRGQISYTTEWCRGPGSNIAAPLCISDSRSRQAHARGVANTRSLPRRDSSTPRRVHQAIKFQFLIVHRPHLGLGPGHRYFWVVTADRSINEIFMRTTLIIPGNLTCSSQYLGDNGTLV